MGDGSDRVCNDVTLAPIVIHALRETHIPAILDACANWAELGQYGPPYWRPRSSAELRRKIEVAAGPSVSAEYHFVVVVGGAGLVGECSVHGIDWRNRIGQIGVCIWNPGARSNGYGRQAAQFLVDWATGYLGLSRLEAWILAGNEPSIRLFCSLGFEHEGTLRERYLHGGVRRDMQIWALRADS
ncbi:GNAT family protein [Mycolicibacterium neoaurum]|uniref:GNAT family N-acetyltransferase n=1 Tax=Mycolicibacterium neoaurum TaxID=1795 RepID=UPI00248C37B7|nr:GNAT family protein [Mycolicibacterium neoaurum]WBP93220.1 GNAT family protein [Mycolicibacterium neoaurum]WBS06813.1 GNAT family protein [Mycolicibacterium neoaurum]